MVRLFLMGGILIHSFIVIGQIQFPSDTSSVRLLQKKANSSYYSKPDSLFFYAQLGLNIARQINDKKGMAALYSNLGDYYSYKGNYKEALDQFDLSIKKAKEINSIEGVSVALMGKGIVYHTLGDYSKAIETYLQCLKLSEQINNIHGIGVDYSNLGVAYKDNKMWKESLEAAGKAIKYYKLEKYKRGIAGVLTNMGSVYYSINKLDTALVFHKNALLLFDSLKNVKGQIICFNNISETYVAKKMYKEASEYANKALLLSSEAGFFSSQIEALFNLAKTNEGLLNSDLAIKYYKEAIQISRERKNKSKLVNLYDGLAKTYYRIGKYKEASDYYHECVVMKDSIFTQESARSISNLKISYEVSEKDRDIILLQKDKEIDKLTLNIILVISGSGLAILGLLIIRLRQKNREEHELRKKNEEVLKFRYNSKITESKLMALRAQLNPHFIFNCLNSINSFILTSDPKKSSDLLIKFSKLIRLILENSNQKLISIEEDVALLNLYIELEKERSKNLFTATIIIDENIDPKLIKVPSLIAQPFIENAIHHGFKRRQGYDNRIILRYLTLNDSLYCTIEDNGVGRPKATESNNSSLKMKSMGIEISNQRLKLLADDQDDTSYIVIEDLIDNNGTGIGTKVIIKIP